MTQLQKSIESVHVFSGRILKGNEFDAISGGVKQVQRLVTDALEGVANKAIADLGAGPSG